MAEWITSIQSDILSLVAIRWVNSPSRAFEVQASFWSLTVHCQRKTDSAADRTSEAGAGGFFAVWSRLRYFAKFRVRNFAVHTVESQTAFVSGPSTLRLESSL